MFGYPTNWVHVRVSSVLYLPYLAWGLLALHLSPFLASANTIMLLLTLYLTNEYRDGDLFDPHSGAPWNGLNDILCGIAVPTIATVLILLVGLLL